MIYYEEMRSNFSKTNRTCPLRKVVKREGADGSERTWCHEWLECGHEIQFQAYGVIQTAKRRRCLECRDLHNEG